MDDAWDALLCGLQMQHVSLQCFRIATEKKTKEHMRSKIRCMRASHGKERKHWLSRDASLAPIRSPTCYARGSTLLYRLNSHVQSQSRSYHVVASLNQAPRAD